MKEFWGYLFAAACLCAIIIFQDYHSDQQVIAAIEQLDTDLCSTINRMHELKGLHVLNCNTGDVRLQALDERGMKILAEYVLTKDITETHESIKRREETQ